MTAATRGAKPSICFVGPRNLPALAPEFRHLKLGGAELQQTLLAKGLMRRGYPVSMIVADLGQPEGATWDGVTTHKAYAPNAGLPGLRFLHPRWTSIRAAARRADADIYYVSGGGALIGQVAHFARARGKKVVFRIAHDKDCQPNELRERLPQWRARVLYQYGLRHANLILAQSSQQHVDLKNHYGLESVVIPSLVESTGAPLRFGERSPHILWVSNLRAFKRPDRALDLARQLPSVRLEMVGGPLPGAREYFEEIRAAASKLPNVVFRGARSYDEVNSLMSTARVFINTSESEGFPNTYMQAWIRGTPVVAFFDPDGLIRREGLGMAVSTIEEMQTAVQGLLENEKAWNTVSSCCRAYANQRHGEGALDAYADAFDSLVSTDKCAA